MFLNTTCSTDELLVGTSYINILGHSHELDESTHRYLVILFCGFYSDAQDVFVNHNQTLTSCCFMPTPYSKSF